MRPTSRLSSCITSAKSPEGVPTSQSWLLMWTVSGKMDEKRAPEADLRSVSGNTTHNGRIIYQSHSQVLCVRAVSLTMSETTSCRLAPPPPNLPKTKRDTERGTGMTTARVADTLTPTSRSREEMNTRSLRTSKNTKRRLVIDEVLSLFLCFCLSAGNRSWSR